MFESERAIAIVANQQPDALRKQQRGGLAPFGFRIIRAMQPSAARGKTAECVAEHSSRVAGARDPLVANSIVRSAIVAPSKAIVSDRQRGARGPAYDGRFMSSGACPGEGALPMQMRPNCTPSGRCRT